MGCMATQQAQIKLNLPSELKKHLALKAGQYGMPLAGYVRFLILKDVSTSEYPTFFASSQTEEAYEKSLKEEAEGKLTSIDKLKDLFEEK